MSDSYICSGARLKCSCGDKISTLTVLPSRTVFLTKQPTANISDHIPMTNIAPFGKCHTVAYPPTGAATSANHGHLTPMPCVPGTISEWLNGKNDYIIKGKPALLKTSYCRCKWGGIITITVDGQTDTGPADLSKENVETEEQWNEQQEQLTVEEILDGIQLALDAAGLFPGLGAIPDLLNAAVSALRRDWAGAGMSLLAAVPIIGDAATAAKLANKGAKMAKASKAAEKTAKAAEKASATAGKSTDNVVSLAEKRAAKTEKLIDESDNVKRLPSKTADPAQSGSSVAKGKSAEVAHINQYERKVEKRVNAPDKVTVTKKTDTIVDSIDNNFRVVESQPSKQTGSSTSYGAGNSNSGGNKGGSGSSSSREKNRIDVLKKKNTEGNITPAEKNELNKLLNKNDPKNSSIFNL